MPKILLVEDNELNRDMLSRRLSRAGFDVMCAADGSEALSMASAGSPNLVLMDLSLPVMDGWDALHQLRTDPATAAIPVIALTAHALVTDRDSALEAGFDDYESKPIEFPLLVDKINRLLGSSPADEAR